MDEPGGPPRRHPRVLTARRNDGSEFPVEISLGSIPTAEGTVVAAMIRDITERERSDQELAART